MGETYTGKVAAVVIPKNDLRNRYLIAKRCDNGEWEFPGGKQHDGESILKTAEREIKEELSLKVNAKELSEEDAYRDGGYQIIPVMAEIIGKEFEVELVDHTDYKWVKPKEVEALDLELENEIKCLKAFNIV